MNNRSCMSRIALNFAEVVMLDLACATGRAVRLSGPIFTGEIVFSDGPFHLHKSATLPAAAFYFCGIRAWHTTPKCTQVLMAMGPMATYAFHAHAMLHLLK